MKQNRIKSRLKAIFIGIGMCVLVIEVCILYLGMIPHPSVEKSLVVVDGKGKLDVPLTRKAMLGSIDTIGSAKTYDILKRTADTFPAENVHGAAHLFGESLFRHDGLEGIRVCDSGLSFGCFHGFLGKAVAAAGLEGVQKLDEICVKQYGSQGLGCAHGIGHGLGEFLGPEKLSQQLDVCESLTWKGRFFGCKEGAFMEYNMPVTGESSQVRLTIRPYDDKSPFGACLTVPKQYQPACFMELSNWWEEVLSKDYRKIGLLCKSVTDTSNREACFLGIGYTQGPKDSYSLEKTRSVCAGMPDSNAELLCKAGASWSFFAMPTQRDRASSVCEYTDPKLTDMCRNKADLLSYTK